MEEAGGDAFIVIVVVGLFVVDVVVSMDDGCCCMPVFIVAMGPICEVRWWSTARGFAISPICTSIFSNSHCTCSSSANICVINDERTSSSASKVNCVVSVIRETI